MCGKIASGKAGVNSIMLPSGGPFFTATAPMRPLPPTRLSTITVSANFPRRPSATRRATWSVAPPAGKTTTIVSWRTTGWACAGRAASKAGSALAAANAFRASRRGLIRGLLGWSSAGRHHVPQRLARHQAAQVVDHAIGNALHALRAAGAREMRRDQHVGRVPERIVGRQRLGIADVEAGAADLSAVQR